MRLHTGLQHLRAGEFRSLVPWPDGEAKAVADHIRDRAEETVEFSLDFFDPGETGETLSTFIDFADELWSAGIAPIPHDAFWISWTQQWRDDTAKMAVHCERIVRHGNNSALGLSIRAFGEGVNPRGIVLFNRQGRLDMGDVRHAYHDANDDLGQMLLQNAFAVVKGLLGALATPQSIRRHEVPPEKLNRARAKKGKELIRPVTVIDVRASRQASAERRGDAGWTMRPHWRRGHIRRLADGRLNPIPPCCVNMETGVPVKPEYVVRI